MNYTCPTFCFRNYAAFPCFKFSPDKYSHVDFEYTHILLSIQPLVKGLRLKFKSNFLHYEGAPCCVTFKPLNRDQSNLL